eukprot:1626338-Rhodomonas_salina.1
MSGTDVAYGTPRPVLNHTPRPVLTSRLELPGARIQSPGSGERRKGRSDPPAGVCLCHAQQPRIAV